MSKQRTRFAILAVIETDDPTLVHMHDDTDRTRVRLAIERALVDKPHIVAIMNTDLAKVLMAFHDMIVRHTTGEQPAKLKDHH